MKDDVSAQKKLAKVQEEIIEEVQNELLEMGALEAQPPIPGSVNSQLTHEVLSIGVHGSSYYSFHFITSPRVV